MQRRQLANVYGLRLLLEPRVQWAAVVAVLAILLVFRASLVIANSSQFVWGYDFSSYWNAGRHVLAGEPIYQAFQLAGPYQTQGIQFEYLYPPFFAVIVAPFAGLFEGYQTGNWVWAAVWTVVTVIAVLALATREELVEGRGRRLLLVGATLGFAPFVGEVIIGGVQLPILALLIGAWLALRTGSWRGELVGGALVGIAALIKVFPGLVILWLLLTGRYRAAVAALVAMAVLAAATVPIVGLQAWLDYPAVLLNQAPPASPEDLLAPSVWLSEVMPPTIARVLVTAVGVALVGWSALRTSAPVSFAVAVAVSILISPALYQHYLVILVLPLLLAVRYAPPLAWGVFAYLLMSGGEQESLGDLVWIVNRALPTLGALLTVGGLIWFGRRTPEPSSSTSSP